MSFDPGPVNLRYATGNDAHVIVDFNMKMALETENKILDLAIITEGVKQVLLNPEKGFYIVAEQDDHIAGALLITTEWSDWRNGFFWWIQSVYVRTEFRRRGLFSQLYSFVKQQALATSNVCGLRLYVDLENVNARKTYHALGMIETDYRLYEEEFN